MRSTDILSANTHTHACAGIQKGQIFVKFTELLLHLVVKTTAHTLHYLSQKLPVFFPCTMRAHTVTLDKPVAMGMLSVSIVSMVLKDTPAGLVLGTEHLIGTDVKVALNLNIT